MGDMNTIGFTPGHSPLHRLDPRTKQILLMSLSVASMWGELIFLLFFSLSLLLCVHAAGLRIHRLIFEIRYFILFLCFVFIVRTVTLDHHWTPGVDAREAMDALMLCWRLLLMVVMGLLLVATTRIAHIRAALIWFLKPVPLVNEKMAGTMVGLIVRFLPMVLFQAGEITSAQRARGIEQRKNPAGRMMIFAICLFRRVFLSADELTVALQARCYNEHRTLPELSFSRQDTVAFALGAIIGLTLLFP